MIVSAMSLTNRDAQVVDAGDGLSVASKKLHSKYVVSARWAGGGGKIVSASWDGNVVVSGGSSPPSSTCTFPQTPWQNYSSQASGRMFVVERLSMMNDETLNLCQLG